MSKLIFPYNRELLFLRSWSAITNAAMASTIGTALGSTQGS